MDQPPRPTADELGISELEYEQILRDLRRREQVVEPAAAPERRLRRRVKRLPLAVLGLVVTVLLVRPGTFGNDEPAYAFLEAINGQPVTYSSCRPVPVAVYPAGGPPDAEALVREAVAQLRTATGLDIVVTGAFGGYAPNWNFEAAPVRVGDPISVSWQDGQAIAHLTDHVAGLGGSRVFTGPRGKYLGSGTIALSRDFYALLAERKDHDEEVAVLLHEFGHVLGLGHVDSSGELMYRKNVGRTSFGPGDLEGLRLLGQGPCS